jgi:L,D-peptidoglycan transpeptidase YkuD (ErfK/YbiS/YcfS/YnhG family)
MRSLFIPLLLLIGSAVTSAAGGNTLRRSRQCVVVTAANWDSTAGLLRAFERREGGSWRARGGQIPVVLGKKGLGWGLGLVEVDSPSDPRKIEGDNKVPAGIFGLGPAFGYAPASSARWIKLDYVPLTPETEGIDDSQSRYYNQLVDRSKVARVDWHSSEQMRRADNLYKWGFVVGHNPAARPGAGSCIFFHIWRNPEAATIGCTAMAEPDLVRLLRWLDPNAHPILVQMPRSDYERVQSRFDLPK